MNADSGVNPEGETQLGLSIYFLNATLEPVPFSGFLGTANFVVAAK